MVSTGSVAGYMTVDSYDSMVKVLRDMSDEEKERLVEGVQLLVGSPALEDLIVFLGQQDNQEAFINYVMTFIKTG